MNKKILWVLLFLVVAEVLLLGVFITKKNNQIPEQKNTQASSSVISESSSSIEDEATDNDNTSTRKINTDEWIESDSEIRFPILMYHSLAESEGNSLKIPPTEFKEHMEWLKENDYYTLTPEEAYVVLTENKQPQEKIVWITFDDGYMNNYTEGYSILKDLELDATINYITSKTTHDAYFKVDEMLEMKNSDFISIESHTVNHLDLNTLDDASIYSDLYESKKWLDSTLDQVTTVLCYPAGRYDERVIQKAKEIGYQMALTTEPGLASSSDGLFELKRVRVNPGYSKENFGAYLQAFE